MKLSKICIDETYNKFVYRNAFQIWDGVMLHEWVGTYVNKKFYLDRETTKVNIKRCVVDTWKCIPWDRDGDSDEDD